MSATASGSSITMNIVRSAEVCGASEACCAQGLDKVEILIGESCILVGESCMHGRVSHARMGGG